MKSKDLISQIKSEITEIEIDAVNSESVTFLDVREPVEIEGGIIANSIHIPRGTLETNIENKIPNQDENIIIYCASGIRSAFAAKTLMDLGYKNVKSLIGGFNGWKDKGNDFEIPKLLSSSQMSRYARHLLLPEVGEVGQQKLIDAKVLLLGAGGLGSPAGMYLAASGVGNIGIIDMDVVDASNLQRQIIHSIATMGMDKTESAKMRILGLNPDCKVTTYNTRLNAENVIDIVSQYDIVLDGTDNFPTRFLLNDASVLLNVPVVHGSIFRFEGQVSVFDPAHGPCYRCFLPEPPPPELAPSCAEAGVLGVLPGIVGSLQALETIKYILGIGDSLVGRLLSFDSLEMTFKNFKIRKNDECKICGNDVKEIVIKEYDQYCRV
ncbi:MAG: molybdopterin-synthase adenylyltransferase MoeB [Acidimicrobiia bacterium]|mgnify:CR=1 FL=1|nr:molybdopterin-synthase adenylyltransferase MoeB [Acidimicrobiia bacterium]